MATSKIDSLLSFGNTKLPKTTMIFNITSATNCPSKVLGLCKVCDVCYAVKSEKLWKTVLPYRTRQSMYWGLYSAEKIYMDIKAVLKRKRLKITAFRINEAGDFRDQEDVSKLDYISQRLKKEFGIVTYCYTARSDLDFSGVSFIVKGSGHKQKNGQTIVIRKGEKVPKRYIVCPANCKVCSLCQKTTGNIAFFKH